MILSSDNLQDIPRLLDPEWIPARSRARQFWEYLHRWRVFLFDSWMREGRGDSQPADLGQLVDHLLGTSLLFCYLKRWKVAGIPGLREIFAGSSPITSRSLHETIQTSFSCPILRSVFDPAWVPANASIPGVILATDWEKRIANALWLLLRDRPLPLSFFGDFQTL